MKHLFLIIACVLAILLFTAQILVIAPMERRRGSSSGITYIIDSTGTLNGNFETASGDDFGSWTEHNALGITNYTTDKYSGARSVRFSGNYRGYLTQDTLEINTIYQYSFWGKALSGTPYLYIGDANGDANAKKDHTLTASWAWYRGSFTTAATVGDFHIGYGALNSDYLVDDLNLWKSGTVATVIASDNFNRANEVPISTNWTGEGDFNLRLVSAAVKCDTIIGGYNFTRWSGAGTFNANQYSSVKVVTGKSNEWMGVMCRASAANSYYVMISNGGGAEFGKYVSGVQTIFSSAAINITDGQVIKIQASGTSITWYVDGVLKETQTDASLSTGAVGMCAYGAMAGSIIDDWEGGNL